MSAIPSTLPGVLPLISDTQRQQIQSAKLADGAQQFEAMMVEQMFKGLHFGDTPGDDSSTQGAGETISSMGTEALGKAIAKAGGFGVAKQIIRQVAAQQQAVEAKQDRAKV